MSQEIFEIVKQMNLDNLEVQIALQCAPLISGLRFSNLFNVNNEQADYLCYAFTILFMKFFRTRIAITPNLSRKSAIPTRHIFSGNSKHLWAKHRAGSAAG